MSRLSFTHPRPRSAGVLAVVATAVLLLSGCSSFAGEQTTEPASDTLAVGDCYYNDGQAVFRVGCDGAHDFVVFALRTTAAVTDAAITADMDAMCDAAADPARLDAVTAFGPTEETVGSADAQITCLYESTAA